MTLQRCVWSPCVGSASSEEHRPTCQPSACARTYIKTFRQDAADAGALVRHASATAGHTRRPARAQCNTCLLYISCIPNTCLMLSHMAHDTVANCSSVDERARLSRSVCPRRSQSALDPNISSPGACFFRTFSMANSN